LVSQSVLLNSNSISTLTTNKMISKKLKSLTSKVLIGFFLIGVLGSCGSKKEESAEEASTEEVVDATEEETVETMEEAPAESMEEAPVDTDTTMSEPISEDSTESE